MSKNQIMWLQNNLYMCKCIFAYGVYFITVKKCTRNKGSSWFNYVSKYKSWYFYLCWCWWLWYTIDDGSKCMLMTCCFVTFGQLYNTPVINSILLETPKQAEISGLKGFHGLLSLFALSLEYLLIPSWGVLC